MSDKQNDSSMNTVPHAARIVVVAIDDNDQAWYEMLIPFVLSIRAAGYRDRLGVIDYGLCAAKRRLLEEQEISIHPSAQTGQLACDRFVSAARVMEQDPRIGQLALYDADIWFTGQPFDLFDHVQDNGRVHVAPDLHYCDYVTGPIIGSNRERLIQQCSHEVIERYGFPLQAGLIAGNRAAWMGFSHFVRSCLNRVGQDFQSIYGLDTTILHLWAAEHDVCLLGQEHNFLPKWGLRERQDWTSGTIVFEHQQKAVRALHMTGDIRYINRWRYLSRHAASALQNGGALSLTHPHEVKWNSCPLAGEASVLLRPLGLEIDGSTTFEPDRWPYVSSSGGQQVVSIHACGSTHVKLRITDAGMSLKLRATHLADEPSCLEVEISRNGEVVYTSGLPVTLQIGTEVGDTIGLRSRCLPGQVAHARWQVSVSGRRTTALPHDDSDKQT
ncbi:hypothetical protein H0X90_34980 [Burkholderia sp. 9775_39]|uniref:hypothetical protein n=1 Tax=unclassified Burkholderia TaxID=2613784 RepID=UPI0018C3F366|nr:MULTISPECIES: hypothetical protein [unclassified Burkholderia]MBG0882005.1 hypothetical protein [Burkholderia sp. 9775_39]MBG0888907.1 hypothetical protein [Burkholderia sp. 9773_38]